MKNISLLFFSLSFIINTYSQAIEFQNYSKKQVLDAEKVFHKFDDKYNIDAKLIGELPQSSYSELDKKIFLFFAHEELFAINPLLEVIDDNLNEELLKTRYDQRISSFLNESTLSNRFNQYKTNYLGNSLNSSANNNARGSSRTAGQNCVNIDFEDGTWSGWDPTYGNSCNTGNRCYNQTAVGSDANHAIVTGGNDPTVAALSVLSPFGGTNSFRLGEMGAGRRAATIAHTFLVDAAKPVFTYAFAVVMEDPGHGVNDQPFFAIDFFDQAGNPINNCGTYYVSAGSGNPGFTRVGNIEWKDWASIYMDMTAYIGQNVTIQFTSSDCNHGGHFGRAYVDAECLKPEITFAPSCTGRDLVAPGGLWQYEWRDNAGNVVGTNPTLTINADGRYYVDLISESGCVITLDTFATVLTPLQISATSVGLSCSGNPDGSITVNGAGGTVGYEYSIDNGANYVATNVFNNLAAATYQVVVRDAFGCTDDTTITLGAKPPINITETHTDPTCTGACNGIVNLTVTGGTVAGNYQYSWNNGAFTANSTSNTLCDGTHTIIVRDDIGCEDTITIVITDPTGLSLNTSNDTTVCNGATVNLNATLTGGTLPYNYTWTSNTLNLTGGNVNFVATDTNVFTVVASDFNNCSVTQTVTVDILPLLSVQAFKDTAICAGESVPLSAAGNGGDGNYTYNWDQGIGAAQSTTVQPNVTTTYTVTFDDGCETPSVTDAVTVTVNPIITLTEVHTDASCADTCDGTITITATGGSNYQYSWDNGPFTINSSKTGLCDGTYTIRVIGDNSCEQSITVVVGEPAPLILTLSNDTTVCNGATVSLNASLTGGTIPYNYSWTSSALTFTGNNVSFLANDTTAFNVVGNDFNNCSVSQTLVVDVLPLLSVQVFNDTSVCLGQSAPISAIGAGGDGNYTYTWDNGIGATQSATVQPNLTTTYQVTLDDGCETPPVTATVMVTINPLPQITFDVDTVSGCTPTTVTFTNTTPANTVNSCFWDFGNGETSSICGTESATYETLGCFDVTLTVETFDGCVDSVTKNNYICNYPNPIADFDATPAVTDVWRTEVVFTNTSSLNDFNFWTYDVITNSNAVDSTIIFPEERGKVYDICLKVTTINGCIDEICKPVEIEDRSYLFVPNSFTPDGDGKNETFFPVLVGIDDDNYNFSIFNKWGDLIFTTDRKEGSWDGMDNGKPAKQDAYVWKVFARSLETGKMIEKRGHVNLFR